MAENNSNYPQLPKNVWRGAWQLIRKAPTRKLDEKALAAELGVQPTAARAYSRELSKLGILEEDGTPTELAGRWRQDGSDPKIIGELLEFAYPQDLRDLAPLGDVDREKIVRWFMNEGLGEGSAKNRAATYMVVANGISEDDEITAPRKKPQNREKPNNSTAKKGISRKDENKSKSEGISQKAPQLAVNVQVHISPDASNDQIESIFSAMSKYFKNE